MNFKASSGLPTPWKSKKMFEKDMADVIYQIEQGTFSIFKYIRSGKAKPLVAAFSRSQITDTGLKVRLVFAVM
jgi:hypothetical protein